MALGLPVPEISVSAWASPSCDFLTGGGFIYPLGTPAGGKGTFGVGGGCKHGSGLGNPPGDYWGHLEYHDHGVPVTIHATKITGYLVDEFFFPDPDKKGRLICGEGTSSLGTPVTFIVRARDVAEPGKNYDEFDIQINSVPPYTTFPTGPHKLGGGNIELHKPNSSNTGVFGGICPGLPGGSGGGGGMFRLTVDKSGNGQLEPQNTVTSVPLGIDCGTDCSESYATGTPVTLTAMSDLGTAISWAGCDTFTDNPAGGTATCMVTMTANRTVTVNFQFAE